MQRRTSDIALAAYALMAGLHLVGGEESAQRGKLEYVFVFNDPGNQWDTLALAYSNSDCNRFDAAMRTLKKLCKRNRWNG